MMQKTIAIFIPAVLCLLLVVGCTSETTSEERAQHENQLEAEINELDAKIQALEARAADNADENKQALNDTLKDLKAQKNEVRGQVQALKVAGSEAWKDVKADVDKAVDKLRASYNTVAKRLE